MCICKDAIFSTHESEKSVSSLRETLFVQWGPFITALNSLSNDCTRGGGGLAQRLEMLLSRAG